MLGVNVAKRKEEFERRKRDLEREEQQLNKLDEMEQLTNKRAKLQKKYDLETHDVAQLKLNRDNLKNPYAEQVALLRELKNRFDEQKIKVIQIKAQAEQMDVAIEEKNKQLDLLDDDLEGTSAAIDALTADLKLFEESISNSSATSGVALRTDSGSIEEASVGSVIAPSASLSVLHPLESPLEKNLNTLAEASLQAQAIVSKMAAAPVQATSIGQHPSSLFNSQPIPLALRQLALSTVGFETHLDDAAKNAEISQRFGFSKY